MAERSDSPNTKPLRDIARQVSLSRWAMVAERAARVFWPVWTLVLGALAAWFLALNWLLEPRGQIIAVAVFVVAALVLLFRALWRFEWPDEAAAVDRLDARLPGKPIAALSDTQAIGRNDPASQAVWTRHLERMAERAKAARAARPDLALARHDPWALRLIALTAALLAALFASTASRLDLAAGLPTGGEVEVATGPSFEAWANPPLYTGLPTVYFGPDTPEALYLPAGTEVTYRVYGADEGFAIAEAVSAGQAGLEEIAEGIRAATFMVSQTGEITLRQGETVLDTRRVTMTPDLPPTIEIAGEVDRTVAGAMELSYAASDDYAVEAAQAEITLDLASVDRSHGLAAEPEPRETLVVDLPLPLSGGLDEIEETLVEDLSQHPWSGLPVTVRLTARDAAAQEGTAERGDIVLPGRRFFDPLARAVVEQRRDLLWSIENRDRVDQMLRTITHAPEDVFTNRTAYLMTRMAIRRMGYMSEDGFDAQERDEIAELLWQVALLIEDGSLSDARERLRRAQDRLSDALRNGATEDEIAELMEQLREAMQDYMDQLAQEAMRNQDQQQAQQMDPNSMQMNQDQLQELLERIEELANSGQQEQAEALLEQLRQMLENMQMQITQGGQNGQQEGQQTLQELQDALRQQQDLADDSFQELQRQFNEGRQQQQGQQGQQQQQGQQGQQGQEGQQPGQQPGQQLGQQGQGQQPGQMPGAQELARRQEALRQMLDDLRGRLPGPSTDQGAEARDQLGEAEDQMGAARDNLDDGDLDGALDRQADAMDALREGIRNLGEEMQQQAQQQQGDNPGQPGEGFARDNTDPLGRPSGQQGNIRSDEHLLPGEEALRRAQELFDEIRRRSGDQSRPVEELEYLKRLLDRF